MQAAFAGGSPRSPATGARSSALEAIGELSGPRPVSKRFGAFALRESGFTAAVVLTLALGIGGNTAIFGVERVDPSAPVSGRGGTGWRSGTPRRGCRPVPPQSCSPALLTIATRTGRTFRIGARTALVRGARLLDADGDPWRPDALDVSRACGRPRSRGDSTHGYWRRRFLGDSSVIGRAMTINARPHTVIGVMPEPFQFSRSSREPELILPLRLESDGRSRNLRRSRVLPG